MSKIYPKSKEDKCIHLLSLKELQKKFDVDFTKGLDLNRVKELQKEQMQNRKEKSTYLKIVKEIFFGLIDSFSLLLWMSVMLFVVLYQITETPDISNYINMSIILFCCLIKSILIGIQEHKSLKLMKRLNSKNLTPVSVLREAKWSRIPACELVVGDVVEISTNERVPADLRLILTDDLLLDKSILTG